MNIVYKLLFRAELERLSARTMHVRTPRRSDSLRHDNYYINFSDT